MLNCWSALFFVAFSRLVAMEMSLSLEGKEDKLQLLSRACKDDSQFNNLLAQLGESAFTMHKTLFDQSSTPKVRDTIQNLERAMTMAYCAPTEYVRFGYRDDLEEQIKFLKESFTATHFSQHVSYQAALLIERFELVKAECWNKSLRENVESWLASSESCFALDLSECSTLKDASLFVKK